MTSKTEVQLKFSKELNIDSIYRIKYCGKHIGDSRCICGQPIKKGYVFYNECNKKRCLVGKNCLPYIIEHLCWNK